MYRQGKRFVYKRTKNESNSTSFAFQALFSTIFYISGCVQKNERESFVHQTHLLQKHWKQHKINISHWSIFISVILYIIIFTRMPITYKHDCFDKYLLLCQYLVCYIQCGAVTRSLNYERPLYYIRMCWISLFITSRGIISKASFVGNYSGQIFCFIVLHSHWYKVLLLL